MAKQLLAFALVPFFFAQSSAPDRRVSGSTLTSNHDPNLQIRLPESAQYVGADRWILYDIADCELHAFVEADDGKNVQRLYWIQFEGYLPSKPELAHAYDSPRHTTIGGLDFFIDTWPRGSGEETRPGSDREHIEALLRIKGYKMPAGMMYLRLVHLLDAKKRKELMIIYGEDLAPTGLSAADLQEKGKARERWPDLEKGLISRAQKSISLSSRSGAGTDPLSGSVSVRAVFRHRGVDPVVPLRRIMGNELHCNRGSGDPALIPDGVGGPVTGIDQRRCGLLCDEGIHMLRAIAAFILG